MRTTKARRDDMTFKMRLVKFPINNAWGFIFGKDIATALHVGMGTDNQMLFETRAGAVGAAERVELLVRKDGIVTRGNKK